MTERGESKMIAKKEWRADFARAISIGIENYRALAEKKKKPMTVADYRRQSKAAPSVEFTPGRTELTLLNPTMEALSIAPSPPPSVPESPTPSPSQGESPSPTPAPGEPPSPPPAETPASESPTPSPAPSATPTPSGSPSSLSLQIPSLSPTPLEIRP